MTKKAIIFDLDNTIYSVPFVADDMLASLAQLIEENGEYKTSIDLIKQDMMRKPFQYLAEIHGFSKTLVQQGFQHLQTLTYDKPLQAFAGYEETKRLPHDKYLVTSGFEAFQRSKIKSLGIENDFKEIHIINPSNNTKKKVFADILQRHHYELSDVIVVGDDMHSEIAAAKELGIDAVLYDSLNLYPDETSLLRITNYMQLIEFL